MAQSVELLLDSAAESTIRAQWSALAAAGLPSEDRSSRPATPGGQHHRPHVTLFAADRIEPDADEALSAAVAGLDLSVVIGGVLVFGPRRGRSVVVRSVLASEALLRTQRRVAEICGADPEGQFGPGRWTPHVTLAHRVPSDQLGDMVDLLGDRGLVTTVTRCRRWDGTAKEAWLL